MEEAKNQYCGGARVYGARGQSQITPPIELMLASSGAPCNFGQTFEKQARMSSVYLMMRPLTVKLKCS